MKKLIGIAFFFLFSANAFGQAPSKEKDTKAILKASYLYSFSKQVDWPDSYKKGDFQIGLIVSDENANLYDRLKGQFEGQQVGNQTISVKEYNSVSEVDSRCNILFIGEGASASLNGFKGRNKSTLLVGEHPSALERGAVIKFVISKNNLAYELSRRNAERYGLTTGNQLRNLAHKVH